MAETKNSFLKGKMNKDLDNRLLPNGEYRDALNISVGKSENQSVGSLQNILGNSQLRKPTPIGSEPFETNENLVCIGYFVDNEKNRIYQFLTDYQDPNPLSINLPPVSSKMKVTVYDPSNSGNPYVTLLAGGYLNLSITNLITGINVVENLLFWTDNRNQPRKINIDSALANPADSPNPYYTNVDQISVAKYAPFTSPIIYKQSNGVQTDVYGASVFIGKTQIIINASSLDPNFTIEVGDQLICAGVTVGDSAIVIDVYFSGLLWYITVTGDYPLIPASSPVTFYKCLMTKTPLESTVNGNDNFLTDRFVRFSYRFKFDDNELSIMAPFTQPAFIPEQKGYFINGNEDAAYRSTVLDWMQNDVNAVTLIIDLPDIGGNILNSYKIKAIDILYKESDSNAVKVVETIKADTIALQSPTTNVYTYIYNSQKPRKTLPAADTLRVYDKIPVRALSQESAGNRIVYGNFINQNTPPSSLDYNVVVLEKNEPFESWIEYPNHTLKQNRTYQVGVVLADKFGRQSSVILSSASPYSTGGDIIYGASSVFFPYKNESWSTNVINWVGDELALIFNTQIISNRDESVGTPGLYATVSGVINGSSDGFQITSSSLITSNFYEFTLAASPAQRNYPKEGDYLKGRYKDYVQVTLVTEVTPDDIEITTDGQISEVYNYNGTTPDIKYSYALNELGWYSYKVVVKQQEQEYYNVYVPGMLSGYPKNQTFSTDAGGGTLSINPSVFPIGEESITCHFVSINDNINKVPRDLSEVGPNQRQYRSSAQLWPRVENVLINPGVSPSASTYTTNRQYYPKGQPDVVNTIAPTNELNFLQNSNPANVDGSASYNIYQFETSPLINRVSTQKQVGVIGNYNSSVPPANYNAMSPFLGVYETQPITSSLDIFWETSTSGYISDLNADVLTGSDAIFSYSSLEFSFNENQNYNGVGDTTGASDSPWVTNWFYFKNRSGVAVFSIDEIVFSVTNKNGLDVTSSFSLIQDLNPISLTYLYWRIKITSSEIYFGTNVDTYGSFVFNFDITHSVGIMPSVVVYEVTLDTSSETLQIQNSVPIITNPAVNLTPIYSLTSDPLVGPIVDMIGKNGNVGVYSGSYLTDLYWQLDPTVSIAPGLVSVNSSTGDINILTNSIPIGDTIVGIKLKDATDSSGLQSPGGLSANRTVKLNVPDFRVGCGTWSSITYNGTPNVNVTSGYINIWKMLRKNETITSSDVWVNEWTDSVGTIHYLPARAMSVVFSPGSPSNFNGTFNYNLGARSAVSLEFDGVVVTSTGRNININFTSIGVLSTPPPTGVYQQAFADTCVSGVPVGYVPIVCREWKIYNNSSFPVPWSGLHGNGHQILGGVLQPGDTVGSPANGGTQPLVRYLSLQSAGTGTIGGIISYTGGSVTCPV